MAPAAMSFMRDHGVLKDIYTERHGDSHKTAKGKMFSVRTVKAPGCGPKSIHRFVLPFIVLLKLKDNQIHSLGLEVVNRLMQMGFERLEPYEGNL